MKLLAVLQILAASSLTRAVQPSAPDPIEAPLRDLEFGTINFLHTTDTHGWHAGHLLEPSFSADWGDYIDFSSRLRENIEAQGQDLLVIDTGDRIEGNGLYDSSEPKGKYTFDIFEKQHIDIICSGNHELYKQNSSENELNILVPAYHNAYLASNLDIINPSTGKFQALAPRFKKFTTKNKRIRILAFGFLFNFTGNYNNTRVQPVQDTIKESWFQRVLGDRAVDLIVVAAHSAARSDELVVIHEAIRKSKPDIPIQFFAGHYHIRDYKKLDDRSYALASGRFMETIGFQSINDIGRDSSGSRTDSSSPTWFRRYIDNNLYSFYHHSKTNATTFHSSYGRSVSAEITAARKALGLDKKFGCAPNDLWMSRVPFPDKTSIYSWLNDSVLPEAVIENDRKDKSRIIMVNTGAIRFDIFKGPFTKDGEFIISPFTSGMHFIPDVPFSQAGKLLDIFNRGGTIVAQSEQQTLSFWQLAPPEQWQHAADPDTLAQPHPAPPADQRQYQIPLSDHLTPSLIPGYTTTDDAGSDGDDTIHQPVKIYKIPNVIQSYSSASRQPDNADPKVDLIFNEFLQPYVLAVLKVLGGSYTDADVRTYLYGETMTDMITRWIKKNWSQDC